MLYYNVNVSFDDKNLFLHTEGNVFSQPLDDYPHLKKATDEQKAKWSLSNVGIHWKEIDEDVSFESFLYDDNDNLVVKRKITR